MKYLAQLILVYLFSIAVAFSEELEDPSLRVAGYGFVDTSPLIEQSNTNIKDLDKLFRKFALFVGYNLDEEPAIPIRTLLTDTITIINELFPANEKLEGTITNTLLPSIPVNAAATEQPSPMSLFVPLGSDNADTFNGYSNGTFTAAGYASKQESASVSISPLIDQSATDKSTATGEASSGDYLKDPVSQSIFNMLGTPNYGTCYYISKKDPKAGTCNLLSENQVMENVMGTPLPNPADFFTYTYNQSIIGQLNSNSLLAPLLLSTEDSIGPKEQKTDEKPGLTAKSQAQLAQNFIRYATYATIPPVLPDLQQYEDVLLNATAKLSEKDLDGQKKKIQATSVLNKYFLNLRAYAAQTSVATGNLMFILSKRLPTTDNKDKKSVTSQALTEYKMATWRLFKGKNTKDSTDGAPNPQWINNLGAASPATVSIEIAQLLAEMNYQLYLNRQIQERILLTNNIILAQVGRGGMPTFNAPEKK